MGTTLTKEAEEQGFPETGVQFKSAEASPHDQLVAFFDQVDFQVATKVWDSSPELRAAAGDEAENFPTDLSDVEPWVSDLSDEQMENMINIFKAKMFTD